MGGACCPSLMWAQPLEWRAGQLQYNELEAPQSISAAESEAARRCERLVGSLKDLVFKRAHGGRDWTAVMAEWDFEQELANQRRLAASCPRHAVLPCTYNYPGAAQCPNGATMAVVKEIPSVAKQARCGGSPAHKMASDATAKVSCADATMECALAEEIVIAMRGSLWQSNQSGRQSSPLRPPLSVVSARDCATAENQMVTTANRKAVHNNEAALRALFPVLGRLPLTKTQLQQRVAWWQPSRQQRDPRV